MLWGARKNPLRSAWRRQFEPFRRRSKLTEDCALGCPRGGPSSPSGDAIGGRMTALSCPGGRGTGASGDVLGCGRSMSSVAPGGRWAGGLVARRWLSFESLKGGFPSSSARPLSRYCSAHLHSNPASFPPPRAFQTPRPSASLHSPRTCRRQLYRLPRGLHRVQPGARVRSGKQVWVW